MKDDLSKIRSAIGRKVNFVYPEDKKQGILKDRAVVESTNRHLRVPYWDVVDLIEFEGEPELRIRIGYYRKPRNSPNPRYASQTTITEPISVWKKILVNAMQEKKWFRDLLEGVMRDYTRHYTQKKFGNEERRKSTKIKKRAAKKAAEKDDWGFRKTSKSAQAVKMLASGKSTAKDVRKKFPTLSFGKIVSALKGRGFQVEEDAKGLCSIQAR